MRLTTRTLTGLAAAASMVLVMGVTPIAAQTPSQPPSQPPSRPPSQPPSTPMPQKQAQQVTSPVQGDLVSVDPDAKTLTVKTASSGEIRFMYTDKTEVSGAQKNVAGLATLKEGRVTVHFTEDPKTKSRTATRIIVDEK